MNTSSRVPGISRNSGWRAVDAEIMARRGADEAAIGPMTRHDRRGDDASHEAVRPSA